LNRQSATGLDSSLSKIASFEQGSTHLENLLDRLFANGPNVRYCVGSGKSTLRRKIIIPDMTCPIEFVHAA